MTLREAFQYQIEKTRGLTQEDLADDTGDIVVWNNVAFMPIGNFYSSGKPMEVGQKLFTGQVVSNKSTPSPILLEESELEYYSTILEVIRVYNNVPVLRKIDDRDDQYGDLTTE
jgi:hypothetical protein